MGSSGGGRTTVQQVPVYTYAGTSGNGGSSASSVTSAVAKSIANGGAEAQTQAQTQARQRSSGIVSTFKRLMGSDTTSGKNKLGQ